MTHNNANIIRSIVQTLRTANHDFKWFADEMGKGKEHPVHVHDKYTCKCLINTFHGIKSPYGGTYVIVIWVVEGECVHPHVNIEIAHAGKDIGNLSTYWGHRDNAKSITKYILDRIRMCEEGRADWLFCPEKPFDLLVEEEETRRASEQRDLDDEWFDEDEEGIDLQAQDDDDCFDFDSYVDAHYDDEPEDELVLTEETVMSGFLTLAS